LEQLIAIEMKTSLNPLAKKEATMSKILLVQDDRSVGKSMIRFLDASGYKGITTWIGGVASLVVSDGIMQGLNIDSQPISVNLHEHVVALLDGHLKIGITSGWALVEDLRKAGIICVGISTMYNELIQQAGAEHVIDVGEFGPFLDNDLPGIYAAACARRSA